MFLLERYHVAGCPILSRSLRKGGIPQTSNPRGLILHASAKVHSCHCEAVLWPEESAVSCSFDYHGKGMAT
jgi:hypothetical protein